MKKPADNIDSAKLNEGIAPAPRQGRYVFFEACVSFGIFTLRIPSAIRYIPPGRRAWIAGLPFTCLSMLLGWWGLPWGLIYTPLVVVTNLSGGCDVTDEILASGGSDHREST